VRRRRRAQEEVRQDRYRVADVEATVAVHIEDCVVAGTGAALGHDDPQYPWHALAGGELIGRPITHDKVDKRLAGREERPRRGRGRIVELDTGAVQL